MFLLFAAASLIVGASAICTSFPSNAVALSGSKVILECRTNTSKKLIWQERLLNASETGFSSKLIFTGNRFSNESSQKYEIVRESDGQFDLTFNATLDHAKQYICQEPGGDDFTAQVTVLASEPNCFVNGKQTTSNLTVVDAEEYIELKCNLTYAGRWIPKMEWKQQIDSGNDWKIIVSQEEAEIKDKISLISTTLAVNATHNVTSYMCTTRFLESGRSKMTAAENIPEYSYNWTSPTFVLRSYYETMNDRKREKEQRDANLELKNKGILIVLMAALIGFAILSIVVVIIMKLNRAKAQLATTRNSVQPRADNPIQYAANNPVSNQLDQPVIYSEVKKKTISGQKMQANHQQEMQQPVIYSVVHKPAQVPKQKADIPFQKEMNQIYEEVEKSDTTQMDHICSHQFSAQPNVSFKVIGADGTEYAQMSRFESRQPLHRLNPGKESFETSVYAPIDHTIVPLPPNFHR